MMRTKLILTSAIIILLSGIVTAQKTTNPDAEMIGEFDRLLSAQFKPDGPGAAAIIARKGNIIYKKAFGMADLELNVPMQPDMIFRIGSITKQFTAVAILQLAQQGKLSVNDEITRFIPDYPTDGHKITIEHLLTHTSGIKSYTSMRSWDSMIRRRDMKPGELVDFFKNEPMDFAPGTRMLYNNSGYILLGYIIEKVSGMSYGEYISKYIFKPVGMDNSYYDNSNTIIRNRVKGYQPGINGIANADFLSMSQPYAAGSLVSTVEDLYKWNTAVHAYSLVGKEAIEKAFVSYRLSNGQETGYGYGWGLGYIQDAQTIEHNGGINGFLTSAIYLPQSDIFVAVFSNCTCNSPDIVTARLAAVALSNPYPEKEITLDAVNMNDYPGVYLNSDGLERTITCDGKELFSQVTGSGRFKIKPYDTDQFMVENSLTLIHFVRSADGTIESVKSLTRTGKPVVWKRSSYTAPEARKMITVQTHILENYAGEYELAPEFSLKITVVGNRIFAQGTGQGSNEIYPESETKFFLEVVDAQIEFIKDDSGAFNKLILYQGGQKIEAKRIRQK